MKDPAGFESNNSDNHDKVAKKLLPMLIQRMTWKFNEVVLDFGCGSGGLTKNILLPEIQAQMPTGGKLEILGTDISKSAIDYAEKTHPHPQINYKAMDIIVNSAEFEGHFDKILSFHVFNWIPEIKPTLQELNKMLKIGGEIGFYCLLTHSLRPGMLKAKEHPEFGDCFHILSGVEDYETELKNCNFEIIDSRLITQDCFFETAGHFMDLQMSLGIFRTPPGKETAFKEFTVESFKNWLIPSPTPENPDGVIYKASIVIILAKKI